MEAAGVDGKAFNIGSGESWTAREAAERIARSLDCEFITPNLTGRHRAGDIRHCFADISLAREELGYEPQIALEKGLADLASWIESQQSTASAA
jgi:dTDP-L-rhamnose 4-epimerase